MKKLWKKINSLFKWPAITYTPFVMNIKKARMIDPERLAQNSVRRGRNVASKNYFKDRRPTYKWDEIRIFGDFLGGRRVKYWKLVYSADDQDGDEYVPIFYKKSKRRRRKR